MELDRESVQMADVEWTKIVMECVVEEGVIDGKVNRGRSNIYRSRPWLCSGRSFVRGSLGLGRIGEVCVLIRRMSVRCKIEPICAIFCQVNVILNRTGALGLGLEGCNLGRTLNILDDLAVAHWICQ